MAIATAGILLLAPFAVLIAIGVPVMPRAGFFYRGQRVGRYGSVFAMRKFRTLRPDAESRLGDTYGAGA